MTTVDSKGDDLQPGMSAYLERFHGVTTRAAAPPKKRKLENGKEEDESDDEQRKKARSVFATQSKGGILGDYMKREREKGAAEVGPESAAIDLTKDEDDEVTFLSETLGAERKEVCLGRIFTYASAFRIPVLPKYQNGKLGRDFWPPARVNYRRSAAQHSIIELFDRSGKDGATFGTRFGSVEGKAAAVLCPLLDTVAVNQMRIKIYLEAAPKKPGDFPGLHTSRSLRLGVTIYAPRNKADGIGRRLSQGQFFLAAPPIIEKGIEYYNPHAPPPQQLGSSKTTSARQPQGSQPTYGVTRTQEEMLRETSTMFDSLVKSDELAEMEVDTDLILTPLMSHQKQALRFLTDRELDDDARDPDAKFSLWKPRDTNKGRVWYNVVTNHEVQKKPDASRGGILADVMGLGKTLSILALIASTLDSARDFGEQEPAISLGENVKRNSKATLIICPKSVMSNWHEQSKQHTNSAKFRVYAYHGPDRIQDTDQLANYDIVLAPYQTAASEFSNATGKRNALGSIQWFRIVLDEAHQIRNPTTHVSKACCALLAQRRWAVTGTPVQNRLEDLGALIKFLKIKPFDDGTSWSQHIIAPFKNANENVLQHLRLLVDSITLRRMKDASIGLPDRVEHIERLTFSDEEMAIYSQFSKASNIQLRIMLREGGLKGKSYAHVLKSLGRLRAVCAHGREMLGEDDLKELEGLTAGTAIDLGDEPDEEPNGTFTTEKHAYDTFNVMSESDVNICICCARRVGEAKPEGDEDVSNELDDSASSASSPVSNSVYDDEDDTMGHLTPCYHLICPQCRDTYINSAKITRTGDGYYTCSYCEQYVRFDLFDLKRSVFKTIIDARSGKKGRHAKWDESTYSGPHTKVKALIDDLKKSELETQDLDPSEPPIRSVVFSGWTSYLDLIEHALSLNNITYVRLDGTMSVKARSAVLQTFSSDPTTTVLLVSIKAGGQGLNFTMANKCYMMEPQFNPGVEQQAIDRVHRLGQKRKVTITHYIMKESVEESILKLQEKKQKLANLSLERKMSRAEEAKKRIEELRELFK